MTDYQEARNFFDAFIGRTWNYPTDVRMGVTGTAHEEWAFANENSEPSRLKKEFASGLNASADLLEKEGGYAGKKTAQAIREILEELTPNYLDNNAD